MFSNHPDLLPKVLRGAPPPETSSPIVNLSRRGFVTASGALVIGVGLAGCAPAAEPPAATTDAGPSPLTEVVGGDATPSLWITIEEDGTVKLTCHRSEMGQQAWTAMGQILADELEADWDRVQIVQALGDPRYGDQNTDGSRSVRFNFHRLRVAGAAMRSMLTTAAAQAWDTDVANCTAEQGSVVNNETGSRMTYGELSAAAGTLPIPAEDELTLKTRDEWRYIGKPMPSLTVPKIVRGQGTFGIDVDRADMVYAVLTRPPQVFGKTGSFDETAALAVPGVLQTVRLPDAAPPAMFQPLGGVAVVASNTWAAIQGRDALEVDWVDGPNAAYDSAAYEAAMFETARQPGRMARNRGNVDLALEDAATRIEAEYYAPHLSQSPMEPPSATAEWDGDQLTCWACVQDPQMTRGVLAGILQIPPENITVHATWLGGAFGRKSKPDFVCEAALIAREVGKPVKVTWTREDEVRHGYYHSVSAQRMEAGLDENGKCTALLHRTVFPSISSTFDPSNTGPSDGELGLGATDTPFDVPNLRVEAGDAKAHVRIGWLRAVSNIYHVFAVQSFAAELAHAAGRDQKDYLLDLIGSPRIVDPNAEGATYGNYDGPADEYPIDTGRLANVTRRAAEMAGWGRTLPEGHGLGIATHRSFLSYVSTAIEVAVDADGNMTIPGIWLSVDAGTVVNPRHTVAQMEGGTLYGLSNALYGEISAENGAVVQGNFPDWRLMRMNESPLTFEVDIVDSNAPPAGVGEPGTPPAAPALTNAIFNATGVRIRRLPILGATGQRLTLADRQDT
ncbi:MAG: molybdopterin-dependent oxidoreductase [Henriciella sp.]|nr:molybdopterin-dependent oxidoreductase [Henriciella sp.]